MKKLFVLFFVIIGLLSSVYAQNKQLTLKDAVIEQYRSLAPEYLNQVQWIGKTSEISIVEGWLNLMKLDLAGKKQKITDISEINSKLIPLNIQQLSYLYGITWIDNDVLKIDHDNKVILYNTKTKTINHIFSLMESASNIKYCKNAEAVAFTVDNNILLVDSKGEIIKITNDSDKGIVNGSDYVHRQEFGINNGIFWSVDGKAIAYYRKDETMVADYPIINVNTRIAENNPVKYPMAGEKSEEVNLCVYHIASGKTIVLKTGEPKEQYLTSITWHPSSKFLFIGILNRDQNHLKMNQYDATTGEFVKTLFEEKNPKYVEPEHPLFFLNTNQNQFVWFSERDNFQHLYLFDVNGKLIKQLTSGKWVVTDLLGFDDNDQFAFFKATKDSPIEQNFYKVEIKTGKITRLSPENGDHDIVLSSDKKYFVDTYSNPVTPRISNIYDNNGKIIKNLLTAKNPLQNYQLPTMSIGTIKAADDSTDLYYRLIFPANLEKGKKYPVIVYVYGGPHAQLITNSWLGDARLWEYYMAQKGYVVFVLDNRGSANRGFEFESVIHRNCGKTEMADQMKGIEFLKNLEYVDMNKIGVHGWSYGGFMTTSLMTNYPDIFKVGVAGCPVIDWKYYEVMYGERYMDTPQDNPEGYKSTSLLNQADKLKGRLLIIHGAIDPVVVWQNSLQFLNKCIENGANVDYFVYPNHEHNVMGADRLHLMQKVTQYFDDFLK